MEKKNINISSLKVFKGSKASEFYGEGYFLHAEGSNYGRKDASGNVLVSAYDEKGLLPGSRNLARFLTCQLKPKRVLVLGCARGYLVKAFRELGVECVGVDISRWAIENAPEDMQKFLYLGDICDLSLFETDEFGITVAFDVFEHIRVPDLYTALNEACRVTVDAILIDLPIEKNDLNPNQSADQDKSHVSVYTDSWWTKELAKRSFLLVGKNVYPYPWGGQGATLLYRKKQALDEVKDLRQT
jgi:2-polyprenyl-3-methyl-5-hydroxy-6-metoxy-1,4-benzoquinol methylase